MATETSNIGFWKFEDNAPNWHHLWNANIDYFLDIALKMRGLSNVNTLVLKDKSILKSNSTWEVVIKRG